MQCAPFVLVVASRAVVLFLSPSSPAMQLHRFCSVQTTILIILAAGMAFSSAKLIVDFVFVVERSPLDPDWKGSVKQYGVSKVIDRWVDHWLYCMEDNPRVATDFDVGYLGLILDLAKDSLKTIYPALLVNKPQDFRQICNSKIIEIGPIVSRPTRNEEAEAIVKRVKHTSDSFGRLDERKGAPVIIVWHVPYVQPHQVRGVHELLKNGVDAVIAFDANVPDSNKEGNTHVCIGCTSTEEYLFKIPKKSDLTYYYCPKFRPFINKLLDLLGKCETEIKYSQCYFDESQQCLTDSSYGPRNGTEAKYVKYCRSGMIQFGEKCRKGYMECTKQCEPIMKQIPCSVTCGTGVEKKVRPEVTDKFTRHCPESQVDCHRPPCPTTATRPPITRTTPRRPTTTMKTALITTLSTRGDTVSPSTWRSVATRTTTALIVTPSMPAGIVLQPWMIAVLVVAAVAVLAVMIGVLACYLRKGRSPAAGAGGRWSRFYTRRSAPRRHHPVARSPGRTHDRQPPRYLSKPRAPSPADHRHHHAPSRPSQAPSRPTLTSKRPAYATMAPTVQSGLPPRRQY